jgi:hypothetical protein
MQCWFFMFSILTSFSIFHCLKSFFYCSPLHYCSRLISISIYEMRTYSRPGNRPTLPLNPCVRNLIWQSINLPSSAAASSHSQLLPFSARRCVDLAGLVRSGCSRLWPTTTSRTRRSAFSRARHLCGASSPRSSTRSSARSSSRRIGQGRPSFSNTASTC